MDNNTEYSIFLHIIEGIGFTQKNDEITLVATLNGVKFEVKGQNTETTTIFNSNFIWECVAGDLKRMKTDNRPIKIECFHKTQKNDIETKKTIGFILLPIRRLQMVKTLKNLQVKLHWHKLCGLGTEWRQSKPEIYLSGIITTKELIDGGQLEEFLDPKPVDSSDSIYIRPSETSLMLKSQHGIYVNLLEDECLLQVGNGPNDCETFIVTLIFRNAKHLDQLVGPGEKENPVFRFHYDFFGGPSDLILVPNSDGVYAIHQKISVNFKSSLESLKEYFKRVFYIPIDLYYNDSIIGNYKFTCVNLLPPSLEAFSKEAKWEVRDNFTLQTVFDIFESSVRPMVEYIFSVIYIPAPNNDERKVQTPFYIDKKARGDMGDKDSLFEFPPTVTSQPVAEEPEVRSATHRIDRGKEKIVKLCRSAPSISSNPRENNSTTDDIAYQVIAELEDWKCQQIDDFLLELKRKEAFHLSQLSAEWERQKKALTQSLQDKLDECSRLTESLEEAQAIVRAKALKQFEEEREFEKTKHELDKQHAVRSMEVEEKVRRIKDDMEYQLKLQGLRLKELQIEKNREADENVKLRAKVLQLEEEITDMKKNYLPKEQLSGLFEELRQLSERYCEMEKSKRFYKEQWAKVVKEAHQLKLQSLKVQEEKLKRSSRIGIDNITNLQSLIFEERAALLTDRNELKTIKDVLTSESDESKSSCES